MTDCEMTRLCAEAAGIELSVATVHGKQRGWYLAHSCADYYPLRDDAQAMALLLWLLSCGEKVVIENNQRGTMPILVIGKAVYPIHTAELLRRAVCECVAKIQRGKNV